MQPFIEAKQAEIIELCRRHQVGRFSVFGSAVRDDFSPGISDVDIRIEFESKVDSNYAKNLDDLHDQLTTLLGCKVDLLTGLEIRNPRLRRIIEEAQVTLYAA